MNEYAKDEQQKEREEERDGRAIVATGLVECAGCGQYSHPDKMTTCAWCGKRMHMTCMDPMPGWLTDDYVCGPRCEIAELEHYLDPKVQLDQEDIDRIGRRLEELREALLPDGIATTLLHLHALRETLTEDGRPAAAQIATEAIAMIRRLAHPDRADRKAV